MVLIHNSLRRKWAAQVIELIALVFQNDEVAAKMNTIIINYSKNNMASYYPVITCISSFKIVYVLNTLMCLHNTGHKS